MIQDQCNKCFKQGTDSCTENIVFDNTSCPNYGKKIVLEKKEDVINPSDPALEPNASSGAEGQEETSSEQSFVYTKEYLKQNTEIRGWLSFFLFSIIAGGFISFIYPIITYNSQEYSGSFFLSIADPVQGFMLFGLACYTLYSFINRETNAVFLAKTYLTVIFIVNLLLVIIGGYEQNGLGSLPQLIRSLIWAVIWFIFLHQSTVVQEVIPVEYRKAKHIDYYIIAAIIIVPLLLIALGLKEIYSTHEEQQANFIENTVLGANEYTDGKIIFKCGDGFSCEKEEIQDPPITIYRLENESLASITICSDYDTDVTLSNFNSYCENWEDESIKDYKSTVIENRTDEINGHDYFVQTKKYTVDENELFWHFVLLFDKQTGKVAVISSYDGGYDEYLKPFLSSIRFK